MLTLTQLIAVSPLAEWTIRRSLWLVPQPTPSLPIQRIGGLTLVRLRADLAANLQTKLLRRVIRQTPLDQRQIVLDVSSLPDADSGLYECLETVVRVANRCHLDLVLSGVSLPKMAYLELTRIANLVTCYEHSGDAIRAFLKVESNRRLDAS